MPFAKFNADGKVEALYRKKIEDDLVEVSNDDPRLDEYLRTEQVNTALNKSFIESDLSIVRILEDLIDVLIEKGAFRFTDLPEMAQEKLLKRRGLRKEFAYMATLFATEDDESDAFISIDMDGDVDSDGLI